MTRWSTYVLDEARLETLDGLPHEAVLWHASATIRQRLRPEELVRRWERQRWTPGDVPLERDRRSWEVLVSPRVRAEVSALIDTFLVGEYTGLDLLSPIMAACPSEDYLTYLATQAADEAVHARAVRRLAYELLGMETDWTATLAGAWGRISASGRALYEVESSAARALLANPGDEIAWLRAVTVFHLLIEGVLALHGQRALLVALRRYPLLPGLRTVFTAMTRDESRHVAFGVHAVGAAVAAGRSAVVLEAFEECLPLVATAGLERDRARPGSAAVRAASAGRRAMIAARLREVGIAAPEVERVVTLAARAQAEWIAAPAVPER